MAPPSSIAGGVTDPSSRRSVLMSILRREPRPPSKRLRRATADDAAAPLTDEALLAIFNLMPDLADLVRIAATCRRWRNLVSGDAAFLSRTPRPLPGRFFGLLPLTLGFFHHENSAAGTCFVPWAVAGARQRHFLGLHGRPSLLPLSTLADDGLFHSSHIVASRNGLLVVELQRAKDDRALRLCVCNPMSGALHVLPPLVVNGDDGLGRYACTVLAADDCNDENTGLARPSSYFHLIMVYTRRGGSATFHSYSPDGGGWSRGEKTVNCGKLSQKQLRLMRGGGVVAHDGRTVFWLAKNVVAALELATLRVHEVHVPWCANGQNFTMANTLLGLSSPEGGLCLIQFDRMSLSPAKRKRRVSIGLYTRDYWGWKMKESIQVDQYLPDDATKVRLRWFCDRSGIVFFSVVAGDDDHRRSEVYTLSLDTKAVEKVARHVGDRDWGDLHGYEMDQAAYLSSLAERDDDMEDT